MLTVTHLLLETIVERPIALNEHKGSALRGAFFHALRGRPNEQAWRGFCGNQTAKECYDCPLLTACPIAALLARHDPAATRGHAIAQPVMIKPPLGDKTDFLSDEPFRFGLSIAGSAAQLLPYVVMAIAHGMPHEGLGRRDRLNDFQQGSFRVRAIHAYHPLRSLTETLWREGTARVAPATLAVSHQDILDYAATLPADRLTLNLLTPMQIIAEGKPLRDFRFRPFFQRLMERLMTLSGTVGAARFFEDEAERHALLAAADAITVEPHRLRWQRLRSYSTRQRKETYLSGMMGLVTLVGDLAPFLPWLVWGAQLHVGKDAVKGDGWYEIGTGNVGNGGM